MFGGSAVLEIRNVATSCPMAGCGGTAKSLDGQYAMTDGVFDLLRGSKFTRDQIARLQAVQAEIRRSDGITEEILTAADAVAPEIGAMLRLAQKNKWRTAAIAGIMLFAMKTCGGEGSSITLNFGPQTHITQTVVAGSYALRDPDNGKQQQGATYPNTAGQGPCKK
jgi:hypothetical protein